MFESLQNTHKQKIPKGFVLYERVARLEYSIDICHCVSANADLSITVGALYFGHRFGYV